MKPVLIGIGLFITIAGATWLLQFLPRLCWQLNLIALEIWLQ